MAVNSDKARRRQPAGQLEMAVGLDTNGLEGWLWEAACSIRGAVDAPKFKDYILPLIFVKRLSDVFDDEIARLTDKFGDREMTLELVEDDHSLVRFYIPPACSWAEIRRLTSNVGQRLTEIIRLITKANQRFPPAVKLEGPSWCRSVDSGVKRVDRKRGHNCVWCPLRIAAIVVAAQDGEARRGNLRCQLLRALDKLLGRCH